MTDTTPPERILKIALDVPLDAVFDYRQGDTPMALGQRVVVSFGRRNQMGVVIGLSDSSEVAADKLKPISLGYHQEPGLDAETLALLKFCADYYQHPYGQALLSALPTRLRQTQPAVSRKQFAYSLTALGRASGLELVAPRKALQRRLLSALAEHQALHETALMEISSGWRKAMAELQQLALVQAHEVLAGLAGTSSEPGQSPQLNPQQAMALDSMLAQAGEFKPWLLYGITGSGKTEVYIRLLQALLADNDGQALVLVPEISLTPQLEQRFRSRLPNLPMVALHSNLGESERLQNWRLAQSGQARIVIGTRLSVFTPMPKLRLLIVDEEHDASYKQQDGMRYHARDVAMVRAQRGKLPIVLGSATPALETWHNAQTGRFGMLSLSNRAVLNAALPDIRCIDVSKVQLQHGLSPQLVAAMQARLERGEQSLLFINRRGYSPVLLCSACNWVAPCPRCSAKLVVHLRQGRLRCHHCGHEQPIARQCPDCGNQELHATGHGTQRLEETLAAQFPHARILRVDRDSTRRKHALSDMLEAVHAQQVDILVGTQMLAKGHDFPNLTLVGVIDTDSALFSPDFRAAERLFAQLMQVAGRAGRAEKAGEVLIQTAFPDHVLFNALRNQDYSSFASTLLDERRITQFPPFIYMALLRAEATDWGLVQQFLQYAVQAGRALGNEVMVYDPVRPQMERLKGMERGQLLLQADTRLPLQQLLRVWVAQLRAAKLGNKVRWAVDVDPLEF